MKKPGDIVRYRVRKNPETAPERDYTAEAQVTEVGEHGLLTLVVTPRRSDPFQVGPVPHISDADSTHHQYWEELGND